MNNKDEFNLIRKNILLPADVWNWLEGTGTQRAYGTRNMSRTVRRILELEKICRAYRDVLKNSKLAAMQAPKKGD